MEFFADIKFIMWVLTLVGIALIKFNDLAHLSKDFKALKDILNQINNKIDKLYEKVEDNEIKIAEIDVRCEERERRYTQMIESCKVQKTAKRKRSTKKKKS